MNVVNKLFLFYFIYSFIYVFRTNHNSALSNCRSNENSAATCSIWISWTNQRPVFAVRCGSSRQSKHIDIKTFYWVSLSCRFFFYPKLILAAWKRKIAAQWLPRSNQRCFKGCGSSATVHSNNTPNFIERIHTNLLIILSIYRIIENIWKGTRFNRLNNRNVIQELIL